MSQNIKICNERAQIHHKYPTTYMLKTVLRTAVINRRVLIFSLLVISEYKS